MKTQEHHFAAFFEDQAEVKREHAKQFLRYLRKHEGKICLPVIKLLRFLGKYRDKQERNTGYLEHQLAYCKKLEKPSGKTHLKACSSVR